MTRVGLLVALAFSPFVNQKLSAQVQGRVERGDVIIHYQVFGEGFPIALLSGGPGASSNALLPIARRLENEYRVVLIEQRGTGRSRLTVLDSTTITLANYVEDVDAVRRDLGIDQWVLLGHSWGGGLAMAVTATHPHHSARMVLIGSIGLDLEFRDYAFDNLRYSAAERAALEFWNDPERRAANPERAAYEYYRALLPARLYRASDLFLILEDLVVEPNFQTIADLMNEDLVRIEYDLAPRLAFYEGPVLVLQGRQGFLGGRTTQKIVETIPNAEIDYIEESGHFPFVEQPEAFFSSLTSFLGQRFR